MSQVTVPPISVNNVQTSLSVHSSAYAPALAHLQHGYSQCKTSQPNTQVGLYLNGTVQEQASVY